MSWIRPIPGFRFFSDGKRVRTIPIPGQTFSDLELMPDGRLALMHNLVRKEIVLVNQKGQVQWTIPLARADVPDPAAISGIYYRAEGSWPGLWAELENAFILLAGPDGRAGEETRFMPGLLTRNGRRLLKAEIVGEKRLLVRRSDEDLRTWAGHEIVFDLPLGIVYGLWEDADGNLYLAANIFDEKNEANEAVVLGPDGKERGRITMALSSGSHEVLKPVRVAPGGFVYQLVIQLCCYPEISVGLRALENIGTRFCWRGGQ